MTQTSFDTDELRHVGETFVAALAGRDFPRLRESLADDVRFRLLTPRGPQANAGAAETVSRFVGWFGGADELGLESSHISTVADRLVITYRLRLRDADGWRLIEQHLVADAGPSGLEAIDLLCTGFHADPDRSLRVSGADEHDAVHLARA